MSYKVFTLKLDAIISDPRELVPPNREVTEVTILKMPAGLAIGLRYGALSDSIDIDFAPISFKPEQDDANAGLYWTNPAASPGSVVKLIVGTRAIPQDPGTREVGSPIPKPDLPGFSH